MNSPADFLDKFALCIRGEFSRDLYQYSGYTGGTGSLLVRDEASKSLVIFKPWLRAGPVGLQDLSRANDRYSTFRGKVPDIVVHVAGKFRENAIRSVSRDRSLVLIAFEPTARELAIEGEDHLPRGLGAAIHACCTSTKIKYVQGLYHMAQSMVQAIDRPLESRPAIATVPAPEVPTLFISYAWESERHKLWVLKLAADLIRNGVEVRIDEWDLRSYGHDLHHFMETCVRDSDHVLLVCTPEYAKRANNRSGGVGVESTIITGEFYRSEKEGNKFIPIIRSEAGVHHSLPTYLSSRFAIDFTRDSEYQARFEELLRRLFKQPRYLRPALGSRPQLDVDEL